MVIADNNDETLVHAYLDGELDVATSLIVERKIATDPACHQLANDVSALKAVLAQKFSPEPVSPQLQKRIAAAVSVRKKPDMRWAALAASLLIGVAISSPLTVIAYREFGHSAVGSEILDAHLRSLLAAQSTDVLSSDNHTVKPWFNGKTAQAPRVVDLKASGFELVGGRVDVVSRRPVPTLVYRRRQHLISLTEMDDAKLSQEAPRTRVESGFNIIEWSESGCTYIAISDLNTSELDEFVKIFQVAKN
jgi:anti-sigma factor RsiW